LDTFVRQHRHAFVMEHSKDVGDRSTLAIMCALRAKGYALPFPLARTRATTS
jgi:hypothetical protein